MTCFTIRHTFNTDIGSYWPKVFFDPEYNERLYKDALAFAFYDVLEQKEEPGGVITRRMRTEPKSDAPIIVKKLIGDSLRYTESGRFDPAKKRWAYNIVPSKLADKIHIAGEFWVEPRGDKSIERYCDCDIQVRIFGVGGAVESFIEKTTRENYEKAARFTNDFIREKGL